jgi:quinol---cytochrome c reductase iron-sulfur subunit, bacillus type
MDRRSFLARVVQFFSVGVSSLFALPVVRFVLGSYRERETGGWYAILRTDEPFTGEVMPVHYSREIRDGWLTAWVEETVLVRKMADGSFVVFDPTCTHLGCAVSWSESAKQFQCPCHGGKYNADGIRVAGPPPKPLNRYEARVTNNVLKIRLTA